MSHSFRGSWKMALALGLALSPAVPRPASADWPPFGRAVCAARTSQTHSTIATDGAGGAIVAWQDARSRKVNVFARRVLATGELDPAWPVDGQALLADSLALADAEGGQLAPVIVADGAGGAIVVWQDLRSGESTAIDLFAQHVLASGAVDPHWKPDGINLCDAAGTQDNQVIVSDGAGGAIVAWMDARAGVAEVDIFAQHLLASGIPDLDWPLNGLAVCTAAGKQQFPAIIGDGAGGAIITWDDTRSGATGSDVFAQHVLGSGTVDRAWPENGLALCTAAGDQGRPTITSDGGQGAIVAWSDSRVVGTSHIFAQHVRISGTVDPAWPLNGRAISNAGVLETRPLPVPDGAGGAVISWQAFTVHLNMFAQHVKANGQLDPAWPAAGRALSITNRQQSHAEIASDGAGGAIVAWEDSSDVVAQHVLLSGALDPTYPDTGRALCNLPSQQGDVAIVAAGPAGAIVSWTDTRSGIDADIFALQVLNAGTVGVGTSGPPEMALAPPSPNPARGSVILRFTLPRDTRVRLAVYDLAGRRVRELASGIRPAGVNAVAWDMRDEGGAPLRAGLYFARLEAADRTLTTRLTALR